MNNTGRSLSMEKNIPSKRIWNKANVARIERTKGNIVWDKAGDANFRDQVKEGLLRNFDFFWDQWIAIWRVLLSSYWMVWLIKDNSLYKGNLVVVKEKSRFTKYFWGKSLKLIWMWGERRRLRMIPKYQK